MTENTGNKAISDSAHFGSDCVVRAEPSKAAKQFAARLNGRQYREEMTHAEEVEAKALGLIVIFGASDDLLEFRGAVDDEVGNYGGGSVMFHPKGAMPEWDDLDKDDEDTVREYFANKALCRTVTADWDTDGYSWVISSGDPHATFEIMEDGEKFCRGIVLDHALPAAPGVAAPAPNEGGA
jgi:hypothetical protein